MPVQSETLQEFTLRRLRRFKELGEKDHGIHKFSDGSTLDLNKLVTKAKYAAFRTSQELGVEFNANRILERQVQIFPQPSSNRK